MRKLLVLLLLLAGPGLLFASPGASKKKPTSKQQLGAMRLRI